MASAPIGYFLLYIHKKAFFCLINDHQVQVVRKMFSLLSLSLTHTHTHTLKVSLYLYISLAHMQRLSLLFFSLTRAHSHYLYIFLSITHIHALKHYLYFFSPSQTHSHIWTSPLFLFLSNLVNTQFGILKLSKWMQLRRSD